MMGNVRKWTGDRHSCEPAVNPSGPDLASLRLTSDQSPSRVIKGGPHLCAANYCYRYRAAARQPQEADISGAHLGFRTVVNKPARRLAHQKGIISVKNAAGNPVEGG
jgi:formylglycine-generating enzyme